MWVVAISVAMVWEECLLHGTLIFLILKPKKLFIVFSFSRKELGSKTRLNVKIGKMMKASRGFKSGQVVEQVMG